MKKYFLLVFITTLLFFFSKNVSATPNKVPEGMGLNLLPSLITPQYLNYLKDLNLDYARTGIPWSSIEKRKGVYNWKEYDSLINTLEKAKVRPLIIIGFNNPVYGADHVFTGVTTSKQREGFANFAAALVSRYRGRGIVWEIWNEPNIGYFWRPSPNPNDYAIMTKYALQKIRKVAPNEVIIAPSVARPNSHLYFNACIDNGIINYIDGLSLHFYKSAGNTVVRPESLEIPRIKGLTNAVKQKRTDKTFIPVVVSELGYSSVWKNIDEYTQGLYLQRELVINKANNVPISIIHTLFNHASDPTGDEGNFGLMRSNLTPKPAYDMVKQVAFELKNAKFIKIYKISSPEDFIYEFEKNNKRVVFAWTIGKKHTVKIYNVNVELTDTLKVIDW